MTNVPVGYKDRRAEGETVLRQCQLVQLHLLHVIDAVCRKYGFSYFLYGGTLLGAMRHDGFIPWDDDLDIGMPIEDYRKFLALPKDEFPADVALQKPTDDPHISIAFAKLRDTSSYYHEVGQYMRTADPSGIYVDIFAFEKMPKLPLALQRLLMKFVATPWMRQRWFLAVAADHVWLSPVLSLCAVACAVFHRFARVLFSVVRAILPSEDYFLELEKGDLCPFKCRWILPLAEHTFEDGKFPVPHDSDACLKASYGDWRQIPPVENRPRHARIIDPFHSAT